MLCVVIFPYIPKDKTSIFLLNVFVLMVSSFSLLKNSYIMLFSPTQRRFRKLISEIEWSLWGFGDTDYKNDFVDEISEIIRDKNSDNIQNEINLQKRSRDFWKKVRKN